MAREPRDYLIKFRPSGRGHRDDKPEHATISAMTCKEAMDKAKDHPSLQNMKILAVYVDPNFWKKLHKAKKTATK